MPKLICWDQRTHGGHEFPCPEPDCVDADECCEHCIWEPAEDPA